MTTQSSIQPATPDTILACHRAMRPLSVLALVLNSLLMGIIALGDHYLLTGWGLNSALFAIVGFTLAAWSLVLPAKSESHTYRYLRDVVLAQWVIVGPKGEIAAKDLYTTPGNMALVTHWRTIRPTLMFAAFVAVVIGGVLLVPLGAL